MCASTIFHPEKLASLPVGFVVLLSHMVASVQTKSLLI